MKENLFNDLKMSSRHPKWDRSIRRIDELYSRKNELRSQFARDYNRILHCTAYRRLKHKTQVFPAPLNDHICTRIEHVNLVSSVSNTISNFLGLNTELVQAIAIGHDLGHTPFGHAGEKILNEILEGELAERFWHEKNSLRFIDFIETLADPNGKQKNLNLTYAVRDGVMCHCGEVDENGIFPRKEYVVLEEMNKPGQFAPFTWEGCVVKISDKIAYLGRDIEDAIELKILSWSQMRKLGRIIRKYSTSRIKEINNTVVLHELITDLCANSNPDEGIRLSGRGYEVMKSLKKFNYDNIYIHERLNSYWGYSKYVMKTIFFTLKKLYCREDTIKKIDENSGSYPLLTKFFKRWLLKYSIPNQRDSSKNIYENKILYDLKKEKDYLKAIIDFISGMTDNFAIRVFDEIITL